MDEGTHLLLWDEILTNGRSEEASWAAEEHAGRDLRQDVWPHCEWIKHLLLLSSCAQHEISLQGACVCVCVWIKFVHYFGPLRTQQISDASIQKFMIYWMIKEWRMAFVHARASACVTANHQMSATWPCGFVKRLLLCRVEKTVLPSLFCPWLLVWTNSGLLRRPERSRIHRGAGRNTLHDGQPKKESPKRSILWVKQAGTGLWVLCWSSISMTPQSQPVGVWSQSMWPHLAWFFSYAGKVSRSICLVNLSGR